MNTSFYEFSQTCLKGIIDIDENVSRNVIIEARNSEEAISIFKPMIGEQDSSCHCLSCTCCEERWDLIPEEIDLELYKKQGYPVNLYSKHKNMKEEWFRQYGEYPILRKPRWFKKPFKYFGGRIYFNNIEQYCQFMADFYGLASPEYIIHYLNGVKVKIFKRENIKFQ